MKPGLMKLGCRHAVLLVALCACNAHASPILFDDRNAFLAAGGPSVLEDFEDANVLPNTVCNTGGPLNADSNNACVNAGDIVAGVSFQALEFAFLGSGAFASPSVTVGPDALFDDLNMVFSPGVQAVGFDFFALGLAANNGVVISLRDSSGQVLWAEIRGTGPAGAFFGAIVQPGEPLISRVISSARPGGMSARIEAIDNLAFGSVSEVPEPGTLLLLALALPVVAGVWSFGPLARGCHSFRSSGLQAKGIRSGRFRTSSAATLVPEAGIEESLLRGI